MPRRPLFWFARYWCGRRWVVRFAPIAACGWSDPIRAEITISPFLNAVVRERTLLHEIAHVYMPWHRKPAGGQWKSEEKIAERVETMRAALRSLGWRAPGLPRGFARYLEQCGAPNRGVFRKSFLRRRDDEL